MPDGAVRAGGEQEAEALHGAQQVDRLAVARRQVRRRVGVEQREVAARPGLHRGLAVDGGAQRLGGGERLLTDDWQDEGPSWAPNGRVITFLRSGRGTQGKADLWMVDLTGVNERRIPTPLDGSDPAWGPLRP